LQVIQKLINMHQIKFNKEENSAELDLSSFFYPMHILQQASLEFEKFAKISVKQKDGRNIVIISAKDPDNVEELALHFCNFALGLKRELGEHA